MHRRQNKEERRQEVTEYLLKSFLHISSINYKPPTVVQARYKKTNDLEKILYRRGNAFKVFNFRKSDI